MSDEYPDAWKAPADRRETPPRSTVRYGSTGTGARFPLTVVDGSSYPASWTAGREPTVLDGVVELGEDDG
ncbi:hypothetical protein [Gordonia bronchialis]|uniref:hypothetical protein n=1 Tax=Gordonia bronchialis TaxID=2054 RepID=UPI0022710A4A|nr:hypothetical protein [Gordonia bronchialis]